MNVMTLVLMTQIMDQGINSALNVVPIVGLPFNFYVSANTQWEIDGSTLETY